MNDASLGPGGIERPVLANEPGDYWGSDAVALMLRELDLPQRMDAHSPARGFTDYVADTTESGVVRDAEKGK